jgi:hypothetical protein
MPNAPRLALKEWQALQAALETQMPACWNQPEFLSDTYPEKALASICASCPIRVECGNYGKTAKPIGGVWNGKRYKRKGMASGDE